MAAPFLLAYVCFAVGILLGLWIHASFWILVPSAICAALSLRLQRYAVVLAAQSLFLVVLGLLFVQHQNRSYAGSELRLFVQKHEMETFRIRGEILQTPEISDDFWVMRVKVTKLANRPLNGTARLTITGDAGDYPPAGSVIETYARLRRPVNYGTEGSFDYESYLRKEDIQVLGSVKNRELIRIVARSRGLHYVFSSLRKKLIQDIRADFSPRDAALLRALWLDDRAGLPSDTEQALIDAGVFHVVAISGFHVAVVLGIGFLLLRRVCSYRTSLLVLGILLLFYYLLLEGRSSITRSFLLFVVFSFAAIRYEKVPWGNALGFAALVQIIMNPLDLFDAGYHLTYLSTAAIVFVAAPLCGKIKLPRKVYRYLADFAITSLSVQLVLAPYQAWTFHRIPLGALLGNWIAIPASSVLIANGVGYMLLPFVRTLLVPVIRSFVHVLLQSSFLVSGKWLLTGIAPAFAAVCGFYLFLIVILISNGKRTARFVCGTLAVVCLIVAVCSPQRRIQGLRVHVIDVGQGDAILLQYPDGANDLIDGGGFWNQGALDVGQSVLLPYFSRIGVTRLRYVFLTHAHADHMNGLFSVIKYIPTEAFYVTRRPVGEAGFQQLCIRWLFDLRTTKKGDVFEHAAAKLRVLSPDDSRSELKVQNDDSLVMLLEYKGHTILLTGDAEHGVESTLASCCLSKIEVVKVPHHGSHTSSTEALLAATQPRLAIVSVGHNNWFGHPHPDVVARYRSHHATLLRTDRDGTIRLTLSESGISIDAYRWK